MKFQTESALKKREKGGGEGGRKKRGGKERKCTKSEELSGSPRPRGNLPRASKWGEGKRFQKKKEGGKGEE